MPDGGTTVPGAGAVGAAGVELEASPDGGASPVPSAAPGSAPGIVGDDMSSEANGWRWLVEMRWFQLTRRSESGINLIPPFKKSEMLRKLSTFWLICWLYISLCLETAYEGGKSHRPALKIKQDATNNQPFDHHGHTLRFDFTTAQTTQDGRTWAIYHH